MSRAPGRARQRRGEIVEKQSLNLIAERFRVLGDPLRLEILHILGDGERTVGSLVDEIGANQANVSKHLQVLRKAGLVERRKEGLHAYYRITDRSIFHLCDLVCGRMSEEFESGLEAIRSLHPPQPRSTG